MKGAWRADWWLTCGICGHQDFIDGGIRKWSFSRSKNSQPIQGAIDRGWKRTAKDGWVHGACLPKKDTE